MDGQDIGKFSNPILSVQDTHSDQFVKIISLYTLRIFCIANVVQHHGQIEEDKERRKSLRHSLIVVACLWFTIGLLVTANIAVNGVYHFYTPTGFCKLHLFLTQVLFDMVQGAGLGLSIRSSAPPQTLLSCGQPAYPTS
jgi:hypothetical protein